MVYIRKAKRSRRSSGGNCSYLQYIRKVIDAEGQSGEVNKNINEIPHSDRGLDIQYKAQPSIHGYSAGGRVGTPTSPGSWEETLQMLSRELQVICRSPDRLDGPAFPPSPNPSLSSCSPLSPPPDSQLRGDLKLLPVRHMQSEEKLREKLTTICRSPRHKLQATASQDSASTPAKLVRPRRKPSMSLPYFRTTIEIGQRGIEDLSVFIEDHTLKVFPNCPSPSQANGNKEMCELPAIIELPTEVNPEKLICVVKCGVLEVRESKRRGPPKGRLLNGLDLRRTLSAGGPRPRRGSLDQGPIVIEADGSQQLKLVLQIPPGFTMEDIKIKTVDDHLIVSGRRGECVIQAGNGTKDKDLCGFFNSKDEIFQVFELPDSVDPYSITAKLTDKHQLVIHATLTPRSRGNTM